MNEPTSPYDARQRRLEQAMAEYLIAADAGRPPDSEAFLAGYPDLRDELAGFLTDRSLLAALIQPLLPAGTAPTTPGAATEPATDPIATGEQPGLAGNLPRTVLIDPAAATGKTTDPVRGITFGPGTQEADASSSLPNGTRVRYFGDYELVKELGRGGMGVVYKARQISLNRPVAVKMIKSAALASDDELRRFQNEAEAVAMLDHPHVVPILEVGNHDGQRYFSMKLIGGTSLDRKLADYVANPRAAATLLKKAAEAVHHAHQRGSLHRDLKPANILLDEHGEPFVTDFGLAKRVLGDSELTHSGAIMGTPAYMAPEQASGRRGAVTTVGDVYGLGAVLYALLTGRAPFQGNSINDTLEQVRESTPTPPSRINPRTPRDLEVICLTCLEKDPARRYASTHALADDLGRYLGGEPIAARLVGRVTRFWMWCRRNPSLAGSLGAAAASLAAVVIFALLYADRKARLATVVADKAREQMLAAKEISNLADDLRIQRDNLNLALATSDRRLAVLHFERGQSAFEKGQTGPGLLWMVECWRSAVAAGDPGWQHTARTNLAAWQSHDVPIKAVFSHLEAVTAVAFSPDGKAVLTGGWDGTARLWDVATGKPIGPPLTHQAGVQAVAFSPDGKAAITGNDDKTARLWTVLELPDDFPRVADWAGVVSGLELDEQGSVHVLDNAAWSRRRERLDREGGPPELGRRWRLDPILFGSEPTARARAWIQRQRWAEAEEAFDEAVLARPLDVDVLLERARFHTGRSRLDKADDDFVRADALGSLDPDLSDTILRSEALFSRAVIKQHADPYRLWIQRGNGRARQQRWREAAEDYVQAVRLQPENLIFRRNQILLLRSAGELDQLQRARSDLLERFGPTTDPGTANSAAWFGLLAPGVDAHLEGLVRLAELGVNGARGRGKAAHLNTLGAALFRAGRFEDAIRRLEEGIQLNDGFSTPENWVFLAMAHHRLGHRDQAHRYLETLRSRRPSTNPNKFWEELEIRLLRSEAEATILYDPIFPTDPFAH